MDGSTVYFDPTDSTNADMSSRGQEIQVFMKLKKSGFIESEWKILEGVLCIFLIVII